MQTAHLHPNIRHIRWHTAFAELSFMVPVIILFAASRGVTFAQFIAIQSMFSVVMLIAGPLVSPLADKYGRRTFVILGSLFWVAGHVLILFGYGWKLYALAEVLLAIAVVAYRPAREALLYDSFLAVNRTDAHFTALTKQGSGAAYAAAVAMAVGGWMFTIHPTIPVIATIAVELVMLYVAWQMVEVPIHRHVSDTAPTYRNMWKQTWTTLSAPHTRWMVILPGLISGSTITLFWSVQPAFMSAGIPPQWSSLLIAAYFAARGLFLSVCPRLVKRFTARQCFAFCIAALFVGFLSMAFLPVLWAFPMFTVGSGFTYMLSECMGKELVNREVASSVRSTAMGAFQLTSRLFGSCTLAACSLLQAGYGLPVALVAIGTIASTLAAVSLTRLPPETI